jgi:hypothetical protein
VNRWVLYDIETSNSSVVDSALDCVSSSISGVSSSRESSAVSHAIVSAVVLQVVSEAVLFDQVAVNGAPRSTDVVSRRSSVEAVSTTESQISISVVDSASYSISSSIVPESLVDLHVEVAVIRAGLV